MFADCIHLLYLMGQYFWFYPYLPYLSFSNLFKGKSPLGFSSLSSIEWRYWTIMLALCFMTLYDQGIWYLQRGLNLFREVCYCDAIRVMRMSDTVEGLALWLTDDRFSTAKYFTCRTLCP